MVCVFDCPMNFFVSENYLKLKVFPIDSFRVKLKQGIKVYIQNLNFQDFWS